jgi:hypothetical protein
MGLDMYLEKKHYVGNKYRKPEQQVRVIVPENQEGITFAVDPIKNERISEITEQVGYWRKANSIHGWFVEHVQNGNDDCKEYYVSDEDLTKLLETVRAVQADHSKAAELLPSTDGFFFGGTDYDNDYFQDLKDTEAIINAVLAEGGSASIYYSSSW